MLHYHAENLGKSERTAGIREVRQGFLATFGSLRLHAFGGPGGREGRATAARQVCVVCVCLSQPLAAVVRLARVSCKACERVTLLATPDYSPRVCDGSTNRPRPTPRPPDCKYLLREGVQRSGLEHPTRAGGPTRRLLGQRRSPEAFSQPLSRLLLV